MIPNHETFARLLLACALLPVGLPARADVSIEVTARCEAAGMCKHYGQRIDGILDQLRFLILQDLQDRPRLDYWSFKAESSPKQNSPLRLEFKILSPQRNVLQLRMDYTAPAARQSWEEVWMEPGQLKTDGYPKGAFAAAEIFKIVRRKLLSPHEDELRSLLERSAPLALGGRWNRDPRAPQIILPLQWDRFKVLSQSQLRLDCTRSSQASDPEVVLITEGTRNPGDYEDGSKRRYKALAVKPRTWRSNRDPEELQRPFAELSNPLGLQPRLAYLHKETLADSAIAVFEGGGQ